MDDPTRTGIAVYLNDRRKVSLPEVSDCFEAMPAEDVYRKRGVLWMDSGLSTHGRVYGYQRVKITETQQTSKGVRVSYSGAVSSGIVMVGPNTFYRLSDSDKLADLVRQHGQALTGINDT